MKDRLNEELTAVLYKHFPQTKELANFLIETLEISKESAYRRIRNEVCFSFEEVSILALKLEISIDKLIGFNTKKVYLNMPLCKTEKPEDRYREILQNNISAASRNLDVKHVMQYSVLNRLPFGITTLSQVLSKFYYYKWCCHRYKGRIKTPFHDFEVPESLVRCIKEYAQTSLNTRGR